jgi:ribonuclease HI
MIIVSEVKFPKKKYHLKKPKEVILRDLGILGNHSRIINGVKNKEDRAHIPKEYEFTIYSDGGYNNTFNVGSWSYYIKVKHGKTHFKLHKASGVIEIVNRLPILMELTAVIMAIKYIESNKEKFNYSIKSVTVYSDNRQVVNSNEKYKIYESNDWFYIRTGCEMSSQLKEAWKELYRLNNLFDVKYVWVRGHSGNLGNERCDEVCTTRLNQNIKVKKIIAYNNKLL